MNLIIKIPYINISGSRLKLMRFVTPMTVQGNNARIVYLFNVFYFNQLISMHPGPNHLGIQLHHWLLRWVHAVYEIFFPSLFNASRRRCLPQALIHHVQFSAQQYIICIGFDCINNSRNNFCSFLCWELQQYSLSRTKNRM